MNLDFNKFTPILSSQQDSNEESGVATIIKDEVKKPKLYKVLLHNDDYTTMEFVIYVLKKHFGKTQEDAEGVMLKVHNEGVGICGVYTYEVAETKVAKVSQEAQASGHPLRCTAEPE